MNPIRAIAFDAYGTLFDVYSVTALAEQLFPGRGDALASLWRERQLEYSRLRTLSNRYAPFWKVTEDALVFAGRKLGLALDAATRQRLMNQYASLASFPENLACLKALRGLGVPLAILSNGSLDMLQIAIRSAGMAGLFDHVLSADQVGRFKTAPEVYDLAPAALAVPAGEILFVSSNGWDACAATWYGFQTFWINRTGQPAEVLDVEPQHTGATMNELLAMVERRLR